ncbi:hypothetical protein JHL17_33575 [Azospirillum sp. YIM B02556]|uniref:Transcriptional regulator n=1 Tax=Azospirillum endophyticum TaxID=2800326 RepID=A0ABS1FG18_9PROT|nr:hypothetical protein [Azospirillum endophyticum]MBK1842337.1 hypothetical protein [Azospirillum endophyticum]
MIERDIRVDADALDQAAAEVAAAWKAAETGHPAVPTDRLYFASWEALCAVLTPKRYELLRHLRQAPAEGIRALARDLGRDVKRVHQDVTALRELGLIERGADGRLTIPVDEIALSIRFAA